MKRAIIMIERDIFLESQTGLGGSLVILVHTVITIET